MSEIASDFPDYVFEKGFLEEDEPWDPDIRETFGELDIRAKKVLDMIFNDDEEQCAFETFSCTLWHDELTVLRSHFDHNAP